MKGFYWGRRAVRCGFCGHNHHNITTCKQVNIYANLALDKMSRISSYICMPQEHRALLEIKRREERKVKQRKKRKESECSYCKSKYHKRPKCPKHEEFRLMVYRANKNWKREFARRVNECGLGVGSLIRLDSQTVRNLDFNIEDNFIAMITEYKLNTLNVFCALNKYGNYQSNSTFQILSGEKTDWISVKYLGWLLQNDLVATGWWYQSDQPVVLSPMSWKPNKEWLDGEWDEILDWFFKNVNFIELKNDGIYDFIEEWTNKV